MASVASQTRGIQRTASCIRLAPQKIWIVTDKLSQAQRSATMRAIKGRDTAPERAIRTIVHNMGYRFRLCRVDLPGKPDLILPRLRAAIFVHGCFWHGHSCKRGSLVPRTNTAFWKTKIGGNRARDKKQVRALRYRGWRVMTIWQCQIKNEKRLVARLQRFLCDKSRRRNAFGSLRRTSLAGVSFRGRG